jgi:hypothetical protein
MSALAASRLAPAQRYKSSTAIRLINGIKKRHSETSTGSEIVYERDRQIHSILDKGIANRYYSGLA